jgi:hypothetical protein
MIHTSQVHSGHQQVNHLLGWPMATGNMKPPPSIPVFPDTSKT